MQCRNILVLTLQRKISVELLKFQTFFETRILSQTRLFFLIFLSRFLSCIFADILSSFPLGKSFENSFISFFFQAARRFYHLCHQNQKDVFFFFFSSPGCWSFLSSTWVSWIRSNVQQGFILLDAFLRLFTLRGRLNTLPRFLAASLRPRAQRNHPGKKKRLFYNVRDGQ